MDIKSIALGFVLGSMTTAGAGYLVYKQIIEPRMWIEINNQTDAAIESYKQGLDKAADDVISVEDAKKIVSGVQSNISDDSSVPLKSFSSLDEGSEKTEGEPVDYSDIYSKYHESLPSQLFNYSDDIPTEIKSDQLDLEAEAVIQENFEKIEKWNQMLAESEHPEEDFDPEDRAARRKEARRMSKKVEEITEEEYFSSNRTYDKETILFYKKDRVMCYENEEVIMDREEILGPDFLDWVDTFCNTKVTSEKGKSIYLRSEFLETDYEVIVYAGSYEHFVNGPDIG